MKHRKKTAWILVVTIIITMMGSSGYGFAQTDASIKQSNQETVEAKASQDGKYFVKIKVGPDADVDFYNCGGFDNNNIDVPSGQAIAVTDAGIDNDYRIYEMLLDEGTYSFRGETTDSAIDLGGMTFDVPKDLTETSEGSDEYQLALRKYKVTLSSQINGTYATDEHFTTKVKDADGRVAKKGDVVASGTSNPYATYLVLANGTKEYYSAAVYPTTKTLTDYPNYTNNITYKNSVTAGTTDASKSISFVTSTILRTINAPIGSKVQIFYQNNNFYTHEETEDKLVSTDSKPDGTVDHVFRTGTSSNYTYRVSATGKMTRTGFFSSSAETINIKYDVNESPQMRPDYNDLEECQMSSAIASRMEDSVLLNINSKNHLALSTGDEYKLRAYRASWQAVNNEVSNVMVEPDFHMNVLQGNDVVDLDTLTKNNSKDNQGVVKAKKNGTAIIEVKYDAMKVGGGGTGNGGIYGATDPARTGIAVVSVNGGDSNNADFSVEGPTKSSLSWDAEFDTCYFLGTSQGGLGYGEMSFAPSITGSAVDSVYVMNKVSSTSNWTALTETNGKYKTRIDNGNNLLRVVDTDGKEYYQLVRGKLVTYRAYSTYNPDETRLEAGDAINIKFDGLNMPMPKFSGIYNPGYNSPVKLTYEKDGKTLQSPNAQYNFINNAGVSATLPDTGTSYTLENGWIQFGNMGSNPGTHRTVDDSGATTNMTAVGSVHYRCILPNVTVAYDNKTQYNVTMAGVQPGSKVVLKDSAGNSFDPDEAGTYNYTLGLGKYTFEIFKSGYLKYTGDFAVSTGGKRDQVVNVSQVKGVEGGWDGYSTSVPTSKAGIYQIGTGAELAWLAKEVNTTNGSIDAELINDINLGRYEWSSIGYTSSYSYTGSFNGKGHTVSDLYVSSNAANRAGLFGYAKGATIKNLTVKGSVNATGNGGYVGGIVCNAEGLSTIENCTNYADITLKNMTAGNAVTGGVVGRVNGTNNTARATVTNCVNLGDINVIKETGTSNYQYIGGVLGYMYYADISNCYNKGDINGRNHVGGVIGMAGSNSIENCYNRGDVSGNQYVGGLIGSSANNTSLKTYVKNCYTTGRISLIDGAPGTFAGAAFGNCQFNDNYENIYYLENSYDTGNGATANIVEAKALSKSEMMKAASILGDAFEKDSSLINNGYPVLKNMDAEGLLEAKSDAFLTLDTHLNLGDYRKEQQKEIIDIISLAKAMISLAQDCDTVDTLLSEALNELDAVKKSTEIEEGKTDEEKLEEAKAEAINEIADHVDFSDYKDEQKEEIQQIITVGQIMIGMAQDQVTIDEIMDYIKSEIDKVKTSKEIDDSKIEDPMYKITATAGIGGKITASGEYKTGTDAVYTYTPNPGYQVSKLVINGNDVVFNKAGGTYTFKSLQHNQDIKVSFTKKTFTVKTSKKGKGSITKSKTVTYGGKATIKIKPSKGYKIAKVTVDGKKVKAKKKYTFKNITKTRTVKVVFKKKNR